MPRALANNRLSHKAFTLVELLTTIAIAALLVAIIVPMVGNYVATARQTADEQTLQVLNDAINRYKMQGGDIAALQSNLTKASLLTLLQTPVTWNGLTHQFLRDSTTISSAQTLSSAGSGQTYRLTQYGSYTSEAGGTELNNSFDKTGLVAWYDFNDATDSHASYDLTAVGTPSYTGGYGVAGSGSNAWNLALGSSWPGYTETTRTFAMRFRLRNLPVGVTMYALYRGLRDRIEIETTGWVRMIITGGLTSTMWHGPLSINTWYLAICEVEVTGTGTNNTKSWLNMGTPATATGSLTGSSADFTIGYQGTNYLDIDISHLSFWSRLLTHAEKTRLYNGGNDVEYSDL